MQRFGFSAAHLQLTMLVDSLGSPFGLWYLRESARRMLTKRSTQESGAVPTLLCNSALNAQEELSTVAKRQIGRATGFANSSAKGPDGLLRKGISSSSMSWKQHANSRIATKSYHPRSVGKKTCLLFGACPRRGQRPPCDVCQQAWSGAGAVFAWPACPQCHALYEVFGLAVHLSACR